MSDTKAVVSVAEMAWMVGLSRARFYQLQKAGVFPAAERDAETGRPFYTEELQRICLEVRRRNCGVNGKPILFYAQRISIFASLRKSPKRQRQHADLIESLQALGLTVTNAQVASAIKEAFPKGTAEMAQAEVVRTVFLHFRRKDSGDKVGR